MSSRIRRGAIYLCAGFVAALSVLFLCFLMLVLFIPGHLLRALGTVQVNLARWFQAGLTKLLRRFPAAASEP